METYEILNRIKWIATTSIIIICLLVCSGCMTYIGKDGPYYGKIVDKETRQPLQGVVVVGDWGRVAYLTGATTHFDTYETVTDKNGNFTIPGQGVQIFSNLSEVQLFALIVGYEDVHGYMWNTLQRLSIGKEGEKIVIGLRKLNMEERKKRSIITPSGPKIKYKLYTRENNKEMVEVGRPKNNIIPEE